MSLIAYARRDTFVFPVSSPGASDISDLLARMLTQAKEHARDNATDWRSLVNSEIERIARECQAPNWDGYGAVPISEQAKANAQRFVDTLPFRLPPADPAPDPDGDIALCWDFGPGRVFTVSVNKDGLLHFAGLLGEGRERHGVEPFENVVPKVIVETIDDLSERVRATGRAAA
jgi:hypothetical protein